MKVNSTEIWIICLQGKDPWGIEELAWKINTGYCCDWWRKNFGTWGPRLPGDTLILFKSFCFPNYLLPSAFSFSFPLCNPHKTFIIKRYREWGYQLGSWLCILHLEESDLQRYILISLIMRHLIHEHLQSSNLLECAVLANNHWRWDK